MATWVYFSQLGCVRWRCFLLRSPPDRPLCASPTTSCCQEPPLMTNRSRSDSDPFTTERTRQCHQVCCHDRLLSEVCQSLGILPVVFCSCRGNGPNLGPIGKCKNVVERPRWSYITVWFLQECSPSGLYFPRESLKLHSRTESSSKAAFLDHSETLWMRSAAAW